MAHRATWPPPGGVPLCPARRARSKPLPLGQHTMSMYTQTPGLRPRAALPRLRAAPTEPAQGGGHGARRRGERPPPAADRRPPAAAAAAAAVSRAIPSPGQRRQQRQSSPSHSKQQQHLLTRRAPPPAGPACAGPPASSNLEASVLPTGPAARDLPSPKATRRRRGRPCIRTDSAGGCRSSVRLRPQVRDRGEIDEGTRATGRVSSITPSGSGRR